MTINAGFLLAMLPVFGVLLGLARPRYPRVPWLAAGGLTALYLAFIAGTGAWAAGCWSCGSETGSSRGDIFTITAVSFGIMVGSTVIAIWLGSRLTVMIGRLRRTIGELRGRE